MRILTFCLILVQVFLISCQGNNSTTKYSLKDSILKEHLFALDSLPYYDTTDINYKVLKAYQNNDTTFLKKLHSDIERGRGFAQQWRSMDSCVQQTKLESLNCDEAYRFIYSGPFCPMKQITTISKSGDSINLNFELYQLKWDAMECKKIDAFNKKITTKNWEEITRLMDRDDFLGLKRENNIHGLDGSTLIVIGYAKEGFNHIKAMKYNYVSRWSSSILRDAFELVTKLSANKQGCLTIK
jgi:hypothetical protein